MAANGRQNTAELASVGGQLMRGDVAVRWLALVAACFLATGVRLGITEAYRSFEEQDRVFRARHTPGWPSGAWYAGTYCRKRTGVAVAAVPGTSNHGLAIALDINNYSNPVVWRWLLDHAAGFGFSWAQGKASGERWHWVFVGGGFVSAVVARPVAIPVTVPRIKRSADMATVYNKQGTSPGLYALAGDSPGTPANWIETTDPGLASAWVTSKQPELDHAIALSADTFDNFRSRYTNGANTR